MKQRQFVLVAALLVGGVSVASAQDAQQQAAQRPGRGNMMAALMQGITLTAEQQTKVDSITKKYADERQALMQDQNLDQDARRAKGAELRNKQLEEVKAVLTDEQKKVLEKNQADLQARMQGGGQRPPQL